MKTFEELEKEWEISSVSPESFYAEKAYNYVKEKMTMIEPHEIILKLKDRNLKEVSRQTGVSYIALVNFTKGNTQYPKYDFIKALSDYLTDKE